MNPDPENEYYEDVLPSFEMHNYLFNRTLFDTERIPQLGLPQYGESYPESTTSSQSVAAGNQISPIDNPDLLVLNNLNTLQTIDLPLEVSIVFTKKFPIFGEPYEKESPLRCYQLGEMIVGFVTIENTCNEIIPFEMLLVSLEGTMTAPQSPNSTCSKYHRQTFLRTYDLSACFHHGCINPTPYKMGECLSRDPVDDTLYGFGDLKEIFPGAKHKKCFAFRLPSYLLETSCSSSTLDHLPVPPSFGVSPFALGGKAMDIRVNEALGYGRADDQGAPIVTNDFCDKGLSITYSVNLRLLGRPQELYKRFYKRHTTHDYQFIIVRDFSIPFRFTNTNIPACHDGRDAEKQIDKIEHQVAETLVDLEERRGLIEAGITDTKEQDQLLAAEGTDKKKSFGFPTDPCLKTPSKIRLGKGFLKTDTQFEVEIQSTDGMALSSFEPAPLKRVALASTKDSSSQLPRYKPSTFSSSSSVFEDVSVSTVPTELNAELTHIDFVLRTTDNVLPQEITVKPGLKALNIYSGHHLPLVFNENTPCKFYEPSVFFKINRKFEHYVWELQRLAKRTNCSISKQLYESLLSLNKMRCKGRTLDVFEEQRIRLKWEKTKEGFVANVNVPLIYESKKTRNVHLIPSFQTCFLARQYVLELKIGKNQPLGVPIRVA
ncbi:hypothetical protein KL938_001456 [Ogataea parapolymorpha]|nr:hypothetical protein KL938_001456 [Ogataea parapolymorpha]